MNKMLTKKEMSAWVKATWEKCQKEAWEQSEMTRDDIIRMAREAGWTSCASDIYPPLERFAELVAAAEREACAMEADYEAARWSYAPEAREPCEEIAKAIRARSRA